MNYKTVTNPFKLMNNQFIGMAPVSQIVTNLSFWWQQMVKTMIWTTRAFK